MFLTDAAGGGLAGVADGTTPVPGSTEPFTGFGTLSLDGGQVAFIGFSDLHQGVYLAAAGALGLVADVGMALEPGSSRTFTGFGDVSLHLGQVALVAGVLITPAPAGPGDPVPSPLLASGVYTGGAGLFSVVAESGVSAPSGASDTFSFADPPTCCASLDGEQVAFAPAGPAGIFGRTGSAAVAVVANGASNVAGDGTGFDVFDRPATHKGRVAFVATGGGRQGVYVAVNGGFQTVADTTTTVPGGAGETFGSFEQPSIHDGAVAFKGCGTGGTCGIYTTLGGPLVKVIADTDTLDGKVVTGLEAGREALSCSSVAFRAFFAASEGIYRADLVGGAGCPAGLGALGPARLWAGLRSSDDQGTAFDLRVEARVNGALAAAGETLCVRGLVRNPRQARLVEVAFPAFGPVEAGPGDAFAVTVLARVGTDGTGARCTGRGATHANARGLRLYFDAAGQASGLPLTLGGGPAKDLFLRASGPPCAAQPSPLNAGFVLDDDAPANGAAKCRDSAGVKQAGGNAWKPVGTWSSTLP